jgi:hypothetical protein
MTVKILEQLHVCPLCRKIKEEDSQCCGFHRSESIYSVSIDGEPLDHHVTHAELLELIEKSKAANARLIAAAPDLFEACKMAFTAITADGTIPYRELEVAFGPCLEKLVHAIAKATGGDL